MNRKSIVLLLTLLFLVFGVILLCSCEPRMLITFKNDTTESLSIFVRGRYITTFNPGVEVKEKTVPAIFRDYEITAFNEKGDKVYSKTYLYKDLEEIDFKIIIKQEDLIQ